MYFDEFREARREGKTARGKKGGEFPKQREEWEDGMRRFNLRGVSLEGERN